MRESAAMKERPIIFSGPMVRAILEGRKTQTRRRVKFTESGLVDLRGPYATPVRDGVGLVWRPFGTSPEVPMPPDKISELCPLGSAGHRLWVREAWAHNQFMPESQCTGPADCFYRATCSEERRAATGWRPSIHMPRWASRITLEITDVRVERVQDISEEDARAEGVEASETIEMRDGSPCYSTPFQILWNSIHGVGAWEGNEWVWVISFRKLP